MTIVDFLDKHIVLVTTILIIFLLVVIIVFAYFIPKISLINQIWKDAKEIRDPLLYRKMYKQSLMKHSFLFASSTRDNEAGYKEIKKYFDNENEIIFVPLDSENFDDKFDGFDTIIYKVHDSEFGIPCQSENPLYKRISKYCSEQHKSCILVCRPGKQIALSESEVEFNPVYVTTVQFYSKLRETLYILLYLT